MKRPVFLLVACILGLAIKPSAVLGKDPPKSVPVVVAARVGDKAIHVAEVEQELAAVLKGQKVDASARPRLLAEMLKQLVERRLVLQYLRAHQQGVGKDKIDAELAAITAKLKQHGLTLPEYLASHGITEEALRDQIDWRLSWKSYVDRHVTDAVVERYFNAHRRDYDGTQVRAAQILLPLKAGGDVAAAQKQAAELRQQIVDGKMAFEDAAARHSSAPSKKQGGDMGWVARQGTLPEPVAAAAFALDAGKVSQPVTTRHGVHLVKVSQIKPGTRTWQDSATELQSALVRRGFSKIVAAEREKGAVEFTGAAPYLDPKTGKLAGSAPEASR